jgi:DNA-binding beta-propeller fold protein YncE
LFSDVCISPLTRRKWLISSASLLSLLTACRRNLPTGYPGYALVSTSADPSLGVVDLATFSLEKPISLHAPPGAVVAGPHAAYALTPSSGSVHVIDRDLCVVRSAKLAGQLSQIRLSPSGQRLFAIAAQDRELIEVDPVTLAVLRRHRLSGEPHSLDVSPAPASACVAVSAASNVVELLNWKTGARVTAGLPRRIGTVRFRRDGLVLLAAASEEPTLSALSVPALETIVDLPLGMQPDNLCFTPDGGQLFISGNGMDAVAIVFPYDTIQVDQTILAGRDPGVMACGSAPQPYLFVGSNTGADVCVIDVPTRVMVGIVNVGSIPTYITFTPDGQYALVLDQVAGTIAFIRIPSIRHDFLSVAHRAGASLFSVLPVGNRPVNAAILPRRT